MNDYVDVYEAQFVENLRIYSAIQKQVKKRVERVLTDPYGNTEFCLKLEHTEQPFSPRSHREH